MAARIRSLVKTGLVMMRVRAWWIRSNISSGEEYADESMP